MSRTLLFKTHSAHETEKLGFLLGREIRASSGTGRHACVVTIRGALGAGKTLFAKGIGRGLGVRCTIHSPTFLLMKRYPIKRSCYTNLWHIDCYRIKKSSELGMLGARDIMHDPRNVVVVEWPDRIRKFLPRIAVRMAIMHSGGGTRIIRFRS